MNTALQGHIRDFNLPLRLSKKTYSALADKASRAGIYKSAYITLLIHMIPVETVLAVLPRYNKDNEKKDVFFPIKIDETTYRMLSEKASACGMNNSAFVRFIIDNVEVCAVITDVLCVSV